MIIEIIEVHQPCRRWWVKLFKVDLTIVLLIFPFTFLCVYMYTQWEDLKFAFLVALISCLLCFISLFFVSHTYEYTYRITFYNEYLEMEYWSLLGRRKRKFRYDRLEIEKNKSRNIGEYVLVRDTVFIVSNQTLANIYGWSEDKQCQFLEMVSSKGVQINNRLR